MAKSETKEAAADPSAYLTKPATPLQERFGDWIMEEVGYDPSTAKTKEAAFREGVRIATATRMVFQASPFNREATEALKAERAEATEEKPVKKAAAAKPVKKAAKKAAAPEPEEDEEEEAPAPKKKVKKAAAKKAVKKAREADEEDEAPF